MTPKLSTAVFAQGWLEGQIENAVKITLEKENEDPTAHLIAVQVQEQWGVVSTTLDELIKENAELNRKLFAVKVAIG